MSNLKTVISELTAALRDAEKAAEYHANEAAKLRAALDTLTGLDAGAVQTKAKPKRDGRTSKLSKRAPAPDLPNIGKEFWLGLMSKPRHRADLLAKACAELKVEPRSEQGKSLKGRMEQALHKLVQAGAARKDGTGAHATFEAIAQ